jgi:RNA polymerase sigma-70 factor (ECF subfamily)
MATTQPADLSLLAAARAGDGRAFDLLVEPHRRELHAHCYRMLASLHDAEDALQETMLRAWRGLARFEGRSSLRTWLYAIATNACIRAVERRPPRTLPLDASAPATIGEVPGRPLVESVWIEPYADERLGPDAVYEQREAVELAFVAALHHLAPLQRAVLLLRQVVGLSASETATALETSVAGVNSALQRARKVIDERAPAQSQQATLRTLGDETRKDLVERYMQAMEAADVDAVIELLVDGATWSMPPLSTWYSGLDAIKVFLEEHPLRQQWRHVPTAANGQPAVLCYLWDDEAAAFTPHALDVLTLAGPRIAAVDAFLGHKVLDEFRASAGSLPAEITT